MMFRTAEFHALAPGENLMPAMLLVPLGQTRRHVHLLDDVPPTHPSVVGAEGDLTLLGGVRDNALLGPSEIVVEQILEPHARHKQQVPAVAPPAHDVSHGSLTRNIAVVASGCAQPLIELL